MRLVDFVNEYSVTTANNHSNILRKIQLVHYDSSGAPLYSDECRVVSCTSIFDNIDLWLAYTLISDTPERPQNITVVETQSQYLVLMWEEPHDNNAPIQGYYVFYNQPSYAMGLMIVLAVNDTMANVTELYPGVTYNFTVIAFNGVGNSSQSAVTPFRTLEEGRSHWFVYSNLQWLPSVITDASSHQLLQAFHRM